MTSTPPEPPDGQHPGQQPDPNPYGAPPPPPPSYGAPGQPAQPAPPAYGSTPAPDPAANPYGAPQYGAPPTPAYGAGGGQAGEPSKGMAIAALVLAIFGCIGISWLVSVVLGVLVLVRAKKGQAGGKGLAVAALVIDLLWFLVGIGFVIFVVVLGANATSTGDLDTGECITADGLAGEGDTVDNIEVVGCTTSHDGEVVATKELTSADVDGYDDQRASDLCMAAISADPDLMNAIMTGGLTTLGLTDSAEPESGDRIACIAFHPDGTKLTAPLG